MMGKWSKGETKDNWGLALEKNGIFREREWRGLDLSGQQEKEGTGTRRGWQMQVKNLQPEEPIPSRSTWKTIFNIFTGDYKKRKKICGGVLLVKFPDQICCWHQLKGKHGEFGILRIEIKHSGSQSEDLGCVRGVNQFKILEGERSQEMHKDLTNLRCWTLL